MSNCHTMNKEKEKQYIINTIKSHGGRITQQREMIVENVLSFSSPFSTDELSQKNQIKDIDLATVYRFINSLLKFKLLTPIDFQDGVHRYEYISKNNKHHHHHVICKNCREIEAVDICLSPQQLNKLQALGYKDVSHNLEFFALCAKCQ